jgi:hypothetical protein
MTVNKSINWLTSSTNKSLLSLQLPEPPDTAEPTLRFFPYTLNRAEATELQAALTDALACLDTFSPLNKDKAVAP